MNHEIDVLAAVSAAFLTAHEKFLRAGDAARAASARELADCAIHATRAAIEQDLAAPGDAWQRRALLEAAIDLDGLESPLAALAARRLAEAAEAGALQAA